MSQYIYIRACRMVERCGTRDPFEAARGCGIYVSLRELGGIKGFYKIINRERHIVINACLPRQDQKLICAHELGHDVLHRAYMQDIAIKEMTLFDMSARPEYEANLFAADLMISDDDMLAALSEGDIKTAAACLEISEPLAICKLFSLKNRGEALNVPVDRVNPFADRIE